MEKQIKTQNLAVSDVSVAWLKASLALDEAYSSMHEAIRLQYGESGESNNAICGTLDSLVEELGKEIFNFIRIDLMKNITAIEALK